VTDLKYAVESACFYWWKYSINTAADLDSVANVTEKVNGGSNGLPEREAKLMIIKSYYSSRGLI
jgi:putative chitinase